MVQEEGVIHTLEVIGSFLPNIYLFLLVNMRKNVLVKTITAYDKLAHNGEKSSGVECTPPERTI